MHTDRLGRRSRFMRSPTGKRLVLTDRDIEILRLLYRYRYLRTPHLLAFFKPKSTKRFVERLGDLFHETGLVHRPPVQWRYCDPRCTSVVYELSSAGQQRLEQQDKLPARTTTISRRATPERTKQFSHAMMIVNALMEVELATRGNINQRFVCVDEILERAPERTRNAKNPLAVPVTIYPCTDFPTLRSPLNTHIIPDGLYGIEYLVDGEKRYRFWALECERTSPLRRSNSNLSSLARKLAAYSALIETGGFKSHWGIPNLKLQVVSLKSMAQSGSVVLTKQQRGIDVF